MNHGHLLLENRLPDGRLVRARIPVNDLGEMVIPAAADPNRYAQAVRNLLDHGWTIRTE